MRNQISFLNSKKGKKDSNVSNLFFVIIFKKWQNEFASGIHTNSIWHKSYQSLTLESLLKTIILLS